MIARSQDEKHELDATLPRRRGVATLWRGLARLSCPAGKIADAQVNEITEARKERIKAMVDALFEAPHPDEFRFRY